MIDQHHRGAIARTLSVALGHAVPPSRLVVVAAHPDDEVIGASSVLHGCVGVTVVHVTDGSPRALDDARAAGYESREEYARARRDERDRALALAGIDAAHVHDLAVADQDATRQLVRITHRLEALLAQLAPDAVMTHPYEGGHPDHDATAFAVHAALDRLAASGRPRPALLEMTSYHLGAAGLESGTFVGADPGVAVLLDEEACRRKRAMFACHATQRRVLADFRADAERFRRAPRYEFRELPNDGALYYAHFPWGTTPESWRARVTAALAALELAAAAERHAC